MRFDFSADRVLAVVAHPDDAELLCAGTLARARDNGAAIGVAVLCQGDKGQPRDTVDNLPALRLSEMTESAALLGATLLRGDIPDGELLDNLEHRRIVIDLLREFRPTLVLAHSPNDYHADHRAAAALTESASWFAASSGHKTSYSPLEAPPALWRMDTVSMLNFEPDLFVDISRYADLKQQLLACHGSQLQRGSDSNFSPLAELMQQQMTARGVQSGVRAAEAFQVHRAWKRIAAW
jgi:LmbE family N-acetylglucosaminyl deacetylase